MPHKRAKRSIREQQRSQKGDDLAPMRGGGGDVLSSEPLPKSFVRAMNAGLVRAAYREKRKLRGEGYEDGEGETAPKKKRQKLDGAQAQIRPGETLAHFNKRIETDMRPLVRSAMQTSLATTRAERKKADSAPSKGAKTSAPTLPTPNPKSKTKPTHDADAEPAPAPPDKHASRPKEFARTSTSAPRRLNDIALAPPDLSAAMARRVATSTSKGKGKGGGTAMGKASALSPAQQLQMAAAREAAIGHYRALKAARRLAGGEGGARGGGAVGEGEGEEDGE
ncbi:hypothetical protein B0H15DRAFT_379457 [Mycena belliarum]|uniref:Uncharacterized protein n=1 Tax=Mycena belliarum TaxID=1033014 RepID=A0AAD6U468_9AGAR|nr:hypothetical protein B0H15DRAFT_379457 [Mycena belliae]